MTYDDEKVHDKTEHYFDKDGQSPQDETDAAICVLAVPPQKTSSRFKKVVLGLFLSILILVGVLVLVYIFVTNFMLPTIVLDSNLEYATEELTAPEIFTAPQTGPAQTIFNITARSTLEIFPKGVYPSKSQRYFEYILPDSFLAGGDSRLQRVESWRSDVNIKAMRFTLTNGKDTLVTPTFGLFANQTSSLTAESMKVVSKFTNTTELTYISSSAGIAEIGGDAFALVNFDVNGKQVVSVDSSVSKKIDRVKVDSEVYDGLWIVGIAGYTNKKTGELRAANFIVTSKNGARVINLFHEKWKKYAVMVRDDNSLIDALSIADKLNAYAWAAQGAYGDNKTPEPSAWDLIEHMKWTAWLSVKGMPKNEAQHRYVDLVEPLLKDRIK